MRDACLIFTSFSATRLWNLLLYFFSLLLSSLFRKPILLNQPWAATIEPSAVCQLSCPECPVGRNEISRAQTFMSSQHFSKILDGLSKKTFWLNLYFQGEPLLDNDIFEKIERARKKKMIVCISTNALELDRETTQKICAAGVSKIIISLDGADEATYSKYRSGGNFQTVLDSIALLRDAKANKRFPIIEVQMLVFSYNENQIQKLREMSLNLGADKFVLKSPQFYDAGNAARNMSSDKNFQRYNTNTDGTVLLKNKTKSVCKRLWNTIVINSDGDVVACCYDKFSHYKMGDAVEKPANAIWKAPTFMQFRSDFLKGKQKDICGNCD